MGNIDCTTQNCYTCGGKGHCLMCVNAELEKENQLLKIENEKLRRENADLEILLDKEE